MDTDYEVVYTTSGRLNAESLKLLLESFGIQAYYSQESAGQTYGLTVGSLGDVEILVPKHQAEAARQVLSAMNRGELSLPDTPGEP